MSNLGSFFIPPGGPLGSRPSASAVGIGALYATDDQSPNVIYRSNGTTWDVWATIVTSGSGGGGGSSGAHLMMESEAEEPLLIPGPRGADGASGGGGSALVFLERHVASSSASLDFTSFISGTYDKYLIVGESIQPATSGADFLVEVGTGGGPTYDTTAGNYSIITSGLDSTGAGYGDTGNALLRVLKSMSNNSAFSGHFSIIATGLQSTTQRKCFFGNTNFVNSNPRGVIAMIGHQWLTTGTAVTALRFIMSSGNIASGSITIYGYANS